MDSRDAQILAVLGQNCREPLRTLSTELGISIAAVQKRLTALEEAKIIRRYTCLIHPGLLGGSAVVLHGVGEISLTQAHYEEISRDPRVFEIDVASGNHLQVLAVLRQPGEVEEVAALMGRLAGIRRPTCDHLDFGPAPEHPLTPFDCSLLLAMRYRGRHTVTALAKVTGAAEQTVRARLDLLMKRRCLMLLAEISIGLTGDQWAAFHVRTAPGLSHRALTEGLPQLENARALWTLRHARGRDRMHVWVWSRTLNDLRALREAYATDPRIEAVIPHLMISSELFPVWIDDELRRRVGVPAGE